MAVDEADGVVSGFDAVSATHRPGDMGLRAVHKPAETDGIDPYAKHSATGPRQARNAEGNDHSGRTDSGTRAGCIKSPGLKHGLNVEDKEDLPKLSPWPNPAALTKTDARPARPTPSNPRPSPA
jgi:hypothetical protein